MEGGGFADLVVMALVVGSEDAIGVEEEEVVVVAERVDGEATGAKKDEEEVPVWPWVWVGVA